MTFDFETMSVIKQPKKIEENSTDRSISDDTLTYVTITQDRLYNIKRNIPIIYPWVDRIVVVDGGSVDGTIEYLKDFDKVELYHRPWDDSFANQYNEYLKHIHGGWVLLCDDDELPSEEMLRALRPLIEKSEKGTKFDVVEFRANSVSYKIGEWDRRVDNGPCEYYRQMFFKWNSNLHYTVDLHQSLQGLKGPGVRCNEHYYHIKSTKDEYRNACRNYFIAGEWPSGSRSDGIRTKEWHELKELLEKHHPEAQLFSYMNALMVSEKLHPDVLDWIVRYKDHNRGVEGESAGELRAFYPYYFEILHPVE